MLYTLVGLTLGVVCGVLFCRIYNVSNHGSAFFNFPSYREIVIGTSGIIGGLLGMGYGMKAIADGNYLKSL